MEVGYFSYKEELRFKNLGKWELTNTQETPIAIKWILKPGSDFQFERSLILGCPLAIGSPSCL